jgi:hypothetical protein
MKTVQHETARYCLSMDRFGNYELTRKSDGASAYFQDDDARLWDDNMEAIVGIEVRGEWTAGNSLDKSFDFLCSGYDDILEPLPATA